MKDLLQYKKELQAKLEAVNKVIADMGGAKVIVKPTKPKRKMSAKARAKISAAQKARWAEKKAKK